MGKPGLGTKKGTGAREGREGRERRKIENGGSAGNDEVRVGNTSVRRNGTRARRGKYHVSTVYVRCVDTDERERDRAREREREIERALRWLDLRYC